MSFFDDASLAFLPSGAAGKDGKAYSIKPTNGDGDFTFSRGSNLSATRVGADGLIEKGRENLLLQSNNFGTTWSNAGTTETSGQSGYDGSSDAWLLSKTSSSGFIVQNISESGVNTFSVYVKGEDSDWVGIVNFGGTNPRCYFDLVNGVAATPNGGAIDGKIEQVGSSDWYRCSITSSGSISSVRIYPAEGNESVGASSGSIYIQDAQLEIGLAATEYIESGASTGKAGLLENEPRFDYSGGATCPSLLLEPSRTNILPYSEYFSGLNTLNLTPVYNQTTSPEGLTNAVKLDDGSTNNVHRVDYNKAITSGQNYCFSVFAKAGNLDYAVMKVYDGSNKAALFNLTNGNVESTIGTLVDSYSEDYGNGWYRLVVIYNAGSASASTQFQTCDTPSSFASSGNAVYQGANNFIYTYGMMEEQGSYPTSYIPNHSGGSVTRGADFANVSSLPNTLSDNYSVFLEINRITNNEANNDDFMNFGSASSDRIRLLTYNNGRVRFRLYFNDGTNQSFFTDSGTWNQGNTIKFCITYNNGTLVIYANGVARHTISQTLNNLVNVTSETQKIKQLLLFNSTLTPSEAITLTTI